MSKKDKNNEMPEQDGILEEQGTECPESKQEETCQEKPDPLLIELEALKNQVAQQEDKYLRLAAEYDNYRKRTAKEKESIWTDVKAEAAAAFLPVYDNLERALKQETADEAFKRGVEMTMTQLKEVLSKLGVNEIPAMGQPFDPNRHNAV
ncbi:MAG: nucleotide exchange factor GrpE, partial [Lawsonibacter sp.]|nr:nucleotide exchange factor GrpE [Lawsonibacter sp.]